jgi:hypothetical protein
MSIERTFLSGGLNGRRIRFARRMDPAHLGLTATARTRLGATLERLRTSGQHFQPAFMSYGVRLRYLSFGVA